MIGSKNNNRPQQSPSMLILATRFAVFTQKQHERVL
jgi:hypothetical protein